MKISVICHSLCGNTWLLAKEFQSSFQHLDGESTLYRVADVDAGHWVEIFPAAAEMQADIAAAPVAVPEVLENSDLIVIGCPTYFGNVSGEMKAFMDSTSMFWPQAKLAGKYFAAFATSGSSEGGAPLCLQAILHYGQHMGMIHIPIPNALIAGVDTCAYGITSVSGGKANIRPDANTLQLVNAYADVLVNVVR